ncbi:MAG TPA: hypothetical protein VHO01_08310 [Jatrophihabitans sp.]|nr:hypothetical protein [Jatrophihabitans sp.]
MRTRTSAQLHRIARSRRVLALAATAACVCALLAACTPSSKSAAHSHPDGSVGTVTVVDPPTDTAVGATATLTVSAEVGGNPLSVFVGVGRREVPLTRHGANWTGTIPARSWLAAGANRLQVRAQTAGGGNEYGYRVVYRESAEQNLGLRLSHLASSGGHAVRVVSTRPVAMVSANLNGHDLTARFRAGVLDQTLPVGGDEGVHGGTNTLNLTAVTATGGYQQASLDFSVPAGTAIAAATTDPGPQAVVATNSLVQASTRLRIHQSIKLDATASRPAVSGAALKYQWRVQIAPAGSTATVQDPGAARASFVPDRPGRYRLAVTVAQPGSSSASTDTTDLTVLPNLPPEGEPVVTQAPGGIDLNGITTGPASGQPLVMQILDRGTLALLATASGGATADSVTTMLAQLAGAAQNAQYSEDGVVAVLSAPAGYRCTPVPGGCAAFEKLLQALGIDDAKKASENDATIHSGVPFSTITVTSSTDSAVWRSSTAPAAFATPLLPGAKVGAGDLSGYLEFPLGSEPAMFINDTNLSFSTSTNSNPSTNTIQLGQCAQGTLYPPTPGMPACQQLASGPLTTCPGNRPTGGFQVAVLWATSLSLITNKTFTTNSGCGTGAIQGDAAQLAAMAATVAPYVSSGGTKDYLVILQSIGSPRPRTSSPSVNNAWTSFGTHEIVPLGGTGSVFDFLGYQSGYALMGYSDTTLPGFGAPFGPESTGDVPHRGNTPPPAVLNGVLARNNRNDFYAQSNAPLAGPAADGLAAIATRPPTPWPAEDTASERAAWKYLTAQVQQLSGFRLGPDLGACWGIDNFSIRDIFCDLPRHSLTLPGYASGHGFDTTTWSHVLGEFSSELKSVGTVDNVLQLLSAPFGSGANGTIDLSKIISSIDQQVEVPVVGPTQSLWSFWLGLFDDAASLVAGFIGVPQGGQLAAAIVNGLGQGMGIASQLIPATAGSAQSQLVQKVSERADQVASDANAVYRNIETGIQSLQPILVTDYGKLARAANVPLTAPDLTDYEYAIDRATQAWAAPLLLSAAFEPDSLTSQGSGVDTTNVYASGPYRDDAANFSCYWFTVDRGTNTYAPFRSPPPGSEYLGGSPTQRYILATPGNPSVVGQPAPRTTITPDLPPSDLLANMFAPVQQTNDVTHLGMLQAHTFARAFGLGAGTAVTCPLSPGLPGNGIASLSDAPGDRHVFYTLAREKGAPYNLFVDDGDPLSATWHGPTQLPGVPDRPHNGATPLAAASLQPGAENVFFLQKGKLVNDYLTSTGWQGPGGLPGTPDSVNNGGMIAAAFGAGTLHVFFWQGDNLVYDYYVPGTGWIGPVTAVANAVSSGNGQTPLAAASLSPGSITVFYLTFGYSSSNVVAATWSNGSWKSSTVVGQVDEQTPLTAASDGTGGATVFFTDKANAPGGSTLLQAVTFTGSGWSSPATVGPPMPYPVATLSGLSPSPNDVEAYLVPPNDDAHNVIGEYQWGPTEGWHRAPALPVPWLTGQY